MTVNRKMFIRGKNVTVLFLIQYQQPTIANIEQENFKIEYPTTNNICGVDMLKNLGIGARNAKA